MPLRGVARRPPRLAPAAGIRIASGVSVDNQQDQFASLVDQHARVIASAIRRVCSRRHRALIPDIEQEVRAALWKRLRSGKEIVHPVFELGVSSYENRHRTIFEPLFNISGYVTDRRVGCNQAPTTSFQNWNLSFGFKSQHSGGCNFAMGDGHVQFIAQTIDYRTYQLLGCRNDGVPVNLP